MSKNLYEVASDYLAGMLPPELTPSDLEKYYLGDNREPASLRDVFLRFIVSAQNYQRMPNVIKFAERKDSICGLLFDFDYRELMTIDPTTLYQQFRTAFHVTSEDSRRNSWYKWSCSIIDSAKFICGFSDVSDFHNFVKQFDYNSATRIALPLLISNRIRGIGFALACDLLKELGYRNYPKPDVHMIEICGELGLSERDPVSAFEALVNTANQCGVTPYKLDKVLWLICSGNFYLDGIKTPGQKRQFIEVAKRELS